MVLWFRSFCSGLFAFPCFVPEPFAFGLAPAEVSEILFDVCLDDPGGDLRFTWYRLLSDGQQVKLSHGVLLKAAGLAASAALHRCARSLALLASGLAALRGRIVNRSSCCIGLGLWLWFGHQSNLLLYGLVDPDHGIW